MSVTLAEFVDSLTRYGLMTTEELRSFVYALPPERRPATAADLARELYRTKKLTKYQAQAIYQGKTRVLVLGNYVVLDRLGRGGMAMVFKAQHRRMQRIVALKVLPPDMMASPDAVERFEQEVKAAARLSHPNIVTAYDADEADGIHFLVMECVDGENLLNIVRECGPLSVPRAIACILQAARGLEYAHNEGIIHRDIKPSNLLLDRRGTIKILDMGLARMKETVAAGDSSNVELVQAGYVIGSVDYMSPEQTYDMAATDHRSDIYSLGCTLHFLLTGRAVYGGDTFVHKVLAHREKPVPSLREARQDIPDGLEAVFRKMVAKKQKDRHQSMTEVIADLQGFVTPASLKGPGPYVALSAFDDSRGTPDWLDESAEPERMPSLDDLLLDEPVQSAEPLGSSAFTFGLRLKARRRKMLTIAGMAGVAVVTWLVFGVVLRPRTREGMVELEISPPGCKIEVLDDYGRVELMRMANEEEVSFLVEPGTHRLQVDKTGYKKFSKRFMIDSGAHLRLTAPLEPGN